jgi:hypothetical protein
MVSPGRGKPSNMTFWRGPPHNAPARAWASRRPRLGSGATGRGAAPRVWWARAAGAGRLGCCPASSKTSGQKKA